MNTEKPSALNLWRMPALVWLALLALLALTVGTAFIPLGLGNGMINAGVAATKVALVMVFFMKLRSSSALTRLTAFAGMFWLILMFALAASDYLTR